MQNNIFFCRYATISGLILGFFASVLLIIQVYLPEDYDEKISATRSLIAIIIAVYALYIYKNVNPDINFSLQLGLKIAGIIAISSAIFLFLTSYSIFTLDPDILREIEPAHRKEMQLFLPISLAFGLFLQTIIVAFVAMIFLRKK